MDIMFINIKNGIMEYDIMPAEKFAKLFYWKGFSGKYWNDMDKNYSMSIGVTYDKDAVLDFAAKIQAEHRIIVPVFISVNGKIHSDTDTGLYMRPIDITGLMQAQEVPQFETRPYYGRELELRYNDAIKEAMKEYKDTLFIPLMGHANNDYLVIGTRYHRVYKENWEYRDGLRVFVDAIPKWELRVRALM